MSYHRGRMLGTAARRALALSLAGALGCGGATLSPSSDAASDVGASHGSPVSDGPDGASACLTGTVNFSLRAAAGNTTPYCLGAPGSCTELWVSILTADGATTLSLVYGCVPDCSSCQPVACPLICAAPSMLGAAGAQKSWDGTFVEHLTCGAAVACTRPACAPAGDYIARMCAYAAKPGAALACLGASTPTCIDVPFTWPPPSGASSVEGVIPAGSDDGGASG
jgi:hypothetical protein